MVDREKTAIFPTDDFRLKQQSSYNRATKTPEDVETWFNNKDHNTKETDQNFIRIEEKNG